MRKRTLVGVVVLTALVGFVAITLRPRQGSQVDQPGLSREPGVGSQTLDPAAGQNLTRLSSSPSTIPSKRPTPEGEGYAMVGLLREELGFTITDREAEIIARHYEGLRISREKNELSLAQREVLEPGSVLITIPEYYEQGLSLYAAFGDGLNEELGRTRAKEIGKALDKAMHAQNSFFGMREQQILVETKGDAFHVVHGSGFMLKMNRQPSFAKRTSVSTLLPQNLGSYEYLRPLFPLPGPPIAR